MTNLPRNPDVIVVGAGAAGLAAAKAVQDQGFEVAVLEAGAYVGGRCVTDVSTFATPFDRGGSWLHSAEINPLARLAEETGDKLHKSDWSCAMVHNDGRLGSSVDVAAYTEYYATMWDAIARAGQATSDASVASVLPSSKWRDTARHWVAQMQGGDAEHVSVQDVARYNDSEGNWLVEGGLGAFVRRLHSDVAIKLNCPVEKVDHSAANIRVTTPDGVLEAKRLILTVSTGVLAQQRIAFFPALPDEKVAAVGNLPMGLLNKVGIQFDEGWRDARQGETADYKTGDGEFCTLLFGFYDGPLAVGFTAGSFADELEAQGAGAMEAFCLEGLKSIFGGDVLKSIEKTSETAWRSYPHTLGSYSYAVPNGADGRAVLAQPVDEKIFFAGEATISTAYATVHGAYLSGLRAAKEAVRSLR